jgi:hypothetical protein
MRNGNVPMQHFGSPAKILGQLGILSPTNGDLPMANVGPLLRGEPHGAISPVPLASALTQAPAVADSLQPSAQVANKNVIRRNGSGTTDALPLPLSTRRSARRRTPGRSHERSAGSAAIPKLAGPAKKLIRGHLLVLVTNPQTDQCGYRGERQKPSVVICLRHRRKSLHRHIGGLNS